MRNGHLRRGSFGFQSWQTFLVCVTVLVLTACTPQQPTLQWEVQIDGKGGPEPITANVTVDSERVYVAAYERNDNLNWSEQHYLQAFDRLTGRPIWRTNLGGFSETRPVIDEQNVYTMSIGSGLYAIDKVSGQQRWFLPLTTDDTSTPTLDQFNIYMRTSQWNDSSSLTREHLLIIDQNNGTIVAEQPLTNTATWQFAVLVAFGQMYYTNDNQILIFNTATKTSTVVFRSTERLTDVLTSDSTYIYAATSDRLLTFDPKSAALAWEIAIPVGIPETVTATADRVYVASRVDENPHSNGTGMLYAIEKSTKQIVWSQSFESGIGLITTDTNLVINMNQDIQAIGFDGGSPSWKVTCEFCFSPRVIGRTMYVADGQGKLRAFKLPEWQQ